LYFVQFCQLAVGSCMHCWSGLVIQLWGYPYYSTARFNIGLLPLADREAHILYSGWSVFTAAYRLLCVHIWWDWRTDMSGMCWRQKTRDVVVCYVFSVGRQYSNVYSRSSNTSIEPRMYSVSAGNIRTFIVVLVALRLNLVCICMFVACSW